MPNPIVELETSEGAIRIELHADRVPGTVENFLQYVDDGHYAGTIFHRVIDGFMVQGGGYDATYTKKPPRAPIQNEADKGVKNVRGTLAMARTSDPHSATAQFFVSVADNGFLNHQAKTPQGWGYTVFGQVIDGMDVVDRIKALPTGAKGPFKKDAPLNEVTILAAKRASD